MEKPHNDCPCIRLNCKAREDCVLCRERHLKKGYAPACERAPKPFRIRQFSLAPMGDIPLLLLQKWRSRESVQTLYGEMDDWPEDDFTENLMLFYKKTPIGIGRISQAAAKEARLNYLLGEEPFLELGVDLICIRLLCQHAAESGQFTKLTAVPASDSMIKAYEQAGFVYSADTGAVHVLI